MFLGYSLKTWITVGPGGLLVEWGMFMLSLEIMNRDLFFDWQNSFIELDKGTSRIQWNIG